MSNKLSAKEKAFFWEEVRQVCSSSRMNKSRTFYQHGKINIYVHSLRVAYICYYWVKKYHLHVDEKALIRGALLHDYFLYDWHDTWFFSSISCTLQCKAGFYTDEERRKYHTKAYVSIDTDPTGM